MAGGRIRARLKRSSLYTFGCIRPPPRESIDEPRQFQGPGFSRHVCCNQPGFHRKKPLKYCTNYISTTKYNVITFLPKALFEQFRRVANLYFLLAAALSLTPVSPFSPYSMIAPLIFVVGLSMAKEAVENWHRFMQDMKVNMRKVLVHSGDGVFVRKPWMKLEVGDVVKVEKDEFFPADLLFLSSSYEDGICYVETMNLDGETNLKVKRSLEVTLPLDDDASFKDFKATIKCEDPNPNLYTFVGNFEYDRQTYPLDPSQILLRDSKLRNTGHVYGVVIFSGHDSKVMQNATKPPSKRSTIEKQMDKIIYVLFTLLVLISLISSIGFAVKTKYQMPNWWYIPADDQGLYDPNKPSLSGFSHLITALILYGYLIPISLYVSIELVKVLQALFINQDIHMYDEETSHLKSPLRGREFKLLNILDFTSKRKRMSVIVQDETGQILLLCKGADSIIFDRLSKNRRLYEEATKKHLNEYAEAGLRTLAFAYRKLDISEYSSWNGEFSKAKTSIGGERDTMLEHLSDIMEKDLILVGATAVEDKLQQGVPQCIDKLAQAGLKLWVLTGDKMETAINIGFACSLLRQGMKQIRITTNVDHTSNMGIKENILMQITNASRMINLEKDPHAAFALIIDGKALTYALEDDLKHQFLDLAIECASVICCRVSPKQKALVTRLVKEGTGKTTLAIGDGANDVGMIQEADIGVGISGVEGMQAVMASDFAIAQFRFLERLLVVHGHWCYKRIAQMICYFFYKNIAFGLTLFYFEAFTGFSGQSVYDDWYMLLFNVVLTSLPVISLGVFEQDVSSEICLQFPALYQQGPRNLFFDWYRIFGWMGNGLYCSLIVFFLNIIIFYDQAFRSNGQTADMAVVGTVMFTCVIYSVNCQIALTMSHFTWIQHFLIGSSIITWYIFLILYGMLSPSLSGNVYQIFLEALSPAPIYWLSTLLVTVACNLPYLAHISFQRSFNPMDHHVIQEIKYYKKDVEDRHMWRREKSKARQDTKIGFSARVDAKIRHHLKFKLQKKSSPRAVSEPTPS
ncbi:putative P-type phospholipid transporter [Helianthus annuus]|nr:putative P-type phospholipid transporter [Helianthus annuus]